MKELLLIIFLVSLFYMSIANRMRNYVKILIMQGALLFLVAVIQLHEVNAFNVAMISLETIVFKTIAVPYFLFYIIRKHHITREAEPFVPHFVSLLITVLIVVATFLVAERVDDAYLDKIFFVTAVSTILFGLYFIVSRRKLLSHIIGYSVIENGVFVLSLAVGNEMPVLVNMGVLLDIFASVLILGIFVGKIGDVFKDADVEQLTELKD